jgi:hypothetical protein
VGNLVGGPTGTVKIWVVAIHDFEGSHVVGRVHVTVKDKFSSWEECYPVIVAGIHEESKVLLHFLVSTLSLTVGLGVICCSECVDDAEFLVKGFH